MRKFVVPIILVSITLIGGVLASIRPLQLMVEELLNEKVDVLIDPRINPHAFQLRPSDILKIKRSDILIVLGYGFEEWLGRVEKDKLCVVTKGLENTLVENPHVWLDPVLASFLAVQVAGCIERVFPERKDIVEKNLVEFQRKMVEISEKFSEDLSKYDGTVIELRPALYHFVKRFFPGDYVHVVGPTQPSLSPRRLREIERICKTEKVKVLIVEKHSNTELAKPIVRLCKMRVLKVDVLGSDAENYYDLLRGVEKVVLEAVR